MPLSERELWNRIFARMIESLHEMVNYDSINREIYLAKTV